MIRKKIAHIKDELLQFSSQEKLFILFVMLCSFCITSEYAVTKPTSNSIFITSYTVKLYPYAWLAVVPLNFLVVTLYNRFLPRLGCFKLFLVTLGFTMGVHVFSAFFLAFSANRLWDPSKIEEFEWRVRLS